MRFVLFTFFLIPLVLSAQVFEASVNKNSVAVGEEFELTFSLDGEGKNFKGPNFKGFRKLSGPNKSSSSSVQIINGKISSSSSQSFTYYLTALNEGQSTISSASIEIDGKVLKSNPITLNITKKSKNANANSLNLEENVFIRARANKREVFQGEQINVSYRLYAKINIADFNIDKLPEHNGFWKEDIETNSKPKQEVLNGIKYNVWDISKSILTPQKSGELLIDPMSADVTLQVKVNQNNNRFRDPFGMFGNYKNVVETIRSNKVKIKVKNLPENPPKSFNGAVGNFELKTSVDKNTLKANEAINLKLQLSGSGNLNLIDNIPVDFSNDFEVYDPEKIDKTFNSTNGVKGKLIFNYLLIPKYQGKYSIPSIDFSYFDLKTKKYQTIKTKVININVLEGSQSNNNTFLSSNDLATDKIIPELRRTDSLKKQSTNSFSKSFWFYFLAIIPIFLLTIFLINRYLRSNINPTEYKYQKSLKIAQKRLQKAHLLMKNDKKEQFFEEIEKSLWLYFSNKFKVNSSDLSKETIQTFLKSHSVSENVCNTFIEVIEDCEFCRFAPSQLESSKMNIVYQKGTDIIITIESQMKK